MTTKPFPEPEREALEALKKTFENQYSIFNGPQKWSAGAGKTWRQFMTEPRPEHEIIFDAFKMGYETGKQTLYADLLSVVDSILAEAGDERGFAKPMRSQQTVQGWIDRLRGVRAAIRAEERTK